MARRTVSSKDELRVPIGKFNAVRKSPLQRTEYPAALANKLNFSKTRTGF